MLAGGECAVEMLEDPEKVLHVLVPLEMGDNGTPRSVWGNPGVGGTCGLIAIIILGEANLIGKSCSSMMLEWKSSINWLRCPGYMESIVKLPVSPEAALGGDQKGLGVLQKGRQDAISTFHVDSMLWKQRQRQ